MSTGPTAAKRSLTADGSVRAAAVRAAPSAAGASAIAAPIPWAAPVTTATLPASDMLERSVSLVGCGSARCQLTHADPGSRWCWLSGRRAYRPAGDQEHRLPDEDIGSAGAVDSGDQRVDGRRAELGQGHADAGDRHV